MEKSTASNPVSDNIKDILVNNYADLSNWIKGTAEKTTNFIGEQTPLFIQEYIGWYFWSSIIWIIFSLILFSIPLILFLKNYKEFLKNLNENSPNSHGIIGMIALVFLIIWTMIGLPILIKNTLSATKACVAPRVVLVEKISELIK